MFVNGVQAGGHTGGYDAFSFDITDLLKKEQGAEQELLVVVEDPTESQVFFWLFGESQFQAIPVGKQWSSGERPFQFIFYTPTSGIWQVGQQ